MAYKCAHCGEMHIDPRIAPPCTLKQGLGWPTPSTIGRRDDRILELQRKVDKLTAALLIASAVCGKNNCNCLGAPTVRKAVEEALS